MALYPKAVQKPLNKRTTPMAAYNFLCLHTMVGYLKSTDSYFRTASVDSHFGIGGIWGSDAADGLDGVVYQWDDTKYRSAANLNGNGDVISVETADNAPQLSSDIAAWTPKQCDAIVDLMVWAHNTHGIPLMLVPDTKPGRRGIAYHRQGIVPWLVSGGTQWSNSTGKVCPGDKRIAQIPGLIARANAIVAGVATEELDVIMAYYASRADYEAAQARIVADQIKSVAPRAFGMLINEATNSMFSADDLSGWLGKGVKTQTAAVLAELANVKAQNAALLAAVTALSQSSGAGTPVSTDQLQTMMDNAAKKAVDSINLDVVRVDSPAAPVA